MFTVLIAGVILVAAIVGLWFAWRQQQFATAPEGRHRIGEGAHQIPVSRFYDE